MKNHLRIISGKWKSRRLKITPTPQLRPSPDAVRETLFNWLPHNLTGKKCLDLFAGSGAFGFEAASRGAASVVMVESARDAITQLHDNRTQLQAEAQVEIVAGRVEKFLRTFAPNPSGGFDIVFLDPPFADGIPQTLCDALHARGSNEILNPHALVYIESPHAPLPIPPSWRIIRQNQCGMVQSTLIET